MVHYNDIIANKGVNMETLKIENENTKMIAHRGLSGLERENTMAAFIAACNKTYYGTECDIHLSKDNVFIICHDNKTGRVSPVNKTIRNCSYDELLEISLYDIDSKITRPYLKIPTLEEYLILSKKYQKKCIIELKPVFEDDEIIMLLKFIKKHNYLENVVFISFIEENLKKIRKFDSEVQMQYLVRDYSKDVLNFCRKVEADVDIDFTNLTKEQVSDFHKYGIKVNVWTVNNPIVALMLIAWNVDFITTNILE